MGISICQPWRRFTTVCSIQLQVCTSTTRGIEGRQANGRRTAREREACNDGDGMVRTTAQRGLQRSSQAGLPGRGQPRPAAWFDMPGSVAFLCSSADGDAQLFLSCCYYISHVQTCRLLFLAHLLRFREKSRAHGSFIRHSRCRESRAWSPRSRRHRKRACRPGIRACVFLTLVDVAQPRPTRLASEPLHG